MIERRKLFHLRKVIDTAPTPQKEALAWMGRMLGPERLVKVETALEELKNRRKPEIVRLHNFEELIEKLPRKTKLIIRMLEAGMNFREIGDYFGQTRNNMRRIEQQAVRKLKLRIPRCEAITEKTFNKYRRLFARMGINEFHDLQEQQKPKQRQQGPIPPLIDYEMLVEDLELSVRATNGLLNLGIRTLGDLLGKNENELLRGRNFGRKSLQEVKEVLYSMNLCLGMKR